jgi:hypothetical protein
MINDFLDANWIANVLSISFTLVVFLLGVPIIFMQTYIPEELRAFYETDEHKRKLRYSALLLLPIVFFFGNHGFIYFINKTMPDEFSFKLSENNILIIHKQIIKIFYYFFCLFFFVFFPMKFLVFSRKAFSWKKVLKQIYLNEFLKN